MWAPAASVTLGELPTYRVPSIPSSIPCVPGRATRSGRTQGASTRPGWREACAQVWTSVDKCRQVCLLISSSHACVHVCVVSPCSGPEVPLPHLYLERAPAEEQRVHLARPVETHKHVCLPKESDERTDRGSGPRRTCRPIRQTENPKPVTD